jgi:hypothetical protein
MAQPGNPAFEFRLAFDNDVILFKVGQAKNFLITKREGGIIMLFRGWLCLFVLVG